MNKRYAFLVDCDKCIGCRGCAMACKNYNRLIPEMTWRYVYPLAEEIYPHFERAFYSLSCNHCENPACLKACPVGAYTKRADGIVAHNPSRCIGCHNCVRSCPYGAPRYNPTARRAEKCSLCYDLIDAGRLPACVNGCVTKALTLINLAEFEETNAIQFPAGYPQKPELNPGTRFIWPRLPRQVRRQS